MSQCLVELLMVCYIGIYAIYLSYLTGAPDKVACRVHYYLHMQMLALWMSWKLASIIGTGCIPTVP